MATETILSPGVLLQEIDKSFITPGVDPSGLAIIGPTVKGPVEIPTYIKDFNSFKEIYGTTIESASNSYEYYTSLTVKNYFQNGGSAAIVTRVVRDAENTWGFASSSKIAPIDTADTTGDGPFTLETLGQGLILNSEGPHNSNGSLDSGSKDNFRWEIKDVNEAQGTFTFIIRRGDDTLAKPIVLETFTECSLDPLSDNYIERRIGTQYNTVETVNGVSTINVAGEFPNKSKYVRVLSVSSSLYEYIAPSGDVQPEYADKLPKASSGSFDGGKGNNLANDPKFGSEGVNHDANSSIQGIKPSDYDKAISLMLNKDEYKFKTLVTPGLVHSVTEHVSQINTILENTNRRGDSFFVADLVNYGVTTNTVTSEAGNLDTSFAASYWPWALVKSTELGRNVWCPASTVIPGVYAKNDSIAAPWFAPAGLTRGGITNVVRVEKKLSKAVRDTLYSNKVNPLATFPGQGIVVFGQKTLQNAKSALDRVNVRRMLLDVKDTINGFSRSILFENNTEQTRDRFVRLATPYLESLVQRQGLYAFQVKMDGQINTPDIIDENKLVGQVFLQPTKTAEFIVLDFTLTPTGASFTD